jgi:hypothetical protein
LCESSICQYHRHDRDNNCRDNHTSVEPTNNKVREREKLKLENANNNGYVRQQQQQQQQQPQPQPQPQQQQQQQQHQQQQLYCKLFLSHYSNDTSYLLPGWVPVGTTYMFLSRHDDDDGN